MNRRILLLLIPFVLFAACVPRPGDPAELIRVNQERELQLLGAWGLTRLATGAAPAPHEKRTLTFQNNGILLDDRWEHRLTYRYAVAPDADHLTLIWTDSTNPNDKPSGTMVQSLAVERDRLELNGDVFKRLALASGATLTPPVALPGATPTLPAVMTPPPQPTSDGRMAVTLGTPFTLRAGERALVTDSADQFGIQFYAVSKDSRCPKSVTCVWAGEGTVQITFEQGGILHPPVLELTTTPPRNTKTIEGYVVMLSSLEPYPATTTPIPQSEYAATFVIAAADASPSPAPTTISQTRCSGLTAAQAQGILGEPVRSEPSGEIIIRAEQEAHALEPVAYGLCGYESESSAASASLPPNAPRVTAPHQGAHAVTVGRLRGGDTLALARIAGILRAANPKGDETPYLILQTRLLAGDTASALGELLKLAKQAPNVNANTLPLGDDALWIWYPYEGGRYAVLLVRLGSDFVVVQAVGGAAMTEAGAQEAMTAAASRLE